MKKITVEIDEDAERYLIRRARIMSGSLSNAARVEIDKAAQAEELSRRDDVWFAIGRNGFTPKSEDGAANEASSVAYQALCGLFEHLEHRSLAHGSGHDMAQEIAAAAEKLVRERWIGDSREDPFPSGGTVPGGPGSRTKAGQP